MKHGISNDSRTALVTVAVLGLLLLTAGFVVRSVLAGYLSVVMIAGIGLLALIWSERGHDEPRHRR